MYIFYTCLLIQLLLPFNVFLSNIEETFNFLKIILEPNKNYSQSNDLGITDEKCLLFEKKILLSITCLYEAKNIYLILIKIYKYSLTNFPQNLILEINLLFRLTTICTSFLI